MTVPALHRTVAACLLVGLCIGLAGCSNLRVGFSIPVGPAGVGVSVGSDGSVGAGVGVSVGGASVGVGTSGRLPSGDRASGEPAEPAQTPAR